MKSDVEVVRRLEQKYREQFLTPVKYRLELKKGCRACGDEKVGPWTISVMSSIVPERNEALIFIVTLCKKCMGNEDRQDDVAERVVTEYLAKKA